MSTLFIHKILRRFVNTLTADDKYSGRNMRKFQEQVQTPLSKKENTFSWSFIAFP